MVRYITTVLFISFISFSCTNSNNKTYKDVKHFSKVFGEDRWYRIYLPHNYYKDKTKKYPVIYYFHGFGGRYKWDVYEPEDDVNYPMNGRKEPPYVMEWQNYVNNHDVIIVTWDGYEPNLHPGNEKREGILYGSKPYDAIRAHESDEQSRGWDFSKYFRELVDEIDAKFRTIPDRNHRGITGLSMGGMTAFYVAGQNKDLVNSVSAFDPADNFPRYGPSNSQVVFPILEMYRSLKGLKARLTITDGDWLKYSDREVKLLYGAALDNLEVHEASYPNHWAADIDKQLDFHMRFFQSGKNDLSSWDYVNPNFPMFNSFDYSFSVDRVVPAFTIFKRFSQWEFALYSRTFLPEGPIVLNEDISVKTPSVYESDKTFNLTSYNISKNSFNSGDIQSSGAGDLFIELPGGGNIVSINKKEQPGSRVKLLPDKNQEYFYFTEEIKNKINLRLINIGNKTGHNIRVSIESTLKNLQIENNEFIVDSLIPLKSIAVNNVSITFSGLDTSGTIGSLKFKIFVEERLEDSTQVIVYETPVPINLNADDYIILDGRTVNDVPIFNQGKDSTEYKTISGGHGNGDGKLDPGEDAIFYIRLPKGISQNDTNTYHRSFLINKFENPYVFVDKLDYKEKKGQASATSVSSVIRLSSEVPSGSDLQLIFRVEKLYNDKNDPKANRAVYVYDYDFARVRVKVY